MVSQKGEVSTPQRFVQNNDRQLFGLFATTSGLFDPNWSTRANCSPRWSTPRDNLIVFARHDCGAYLAAVGRGDGGARTGGATRAMMIPTRLQDGLDPVGVVDDYVDGAGITDNNDGGRNNPNNDPNSASFFSSALIQGRGQQLNPAAAAAANNSGLASGGDAGLSTVIDGVSSAGGGVVVEGRPTCSSSSNCRRTDC